MSDTKNTQTKTPASKVPAEYLQPNGKYKPGHDAKHAGVVARRVMEDGKTSHFNELPSEKLKAKALNLVNLWTAKEEAKQAAAAERDAKREAKALADAEAKAAKAEAKSSK